MKNTLGPLWPGWNRSRSGTRRSVKAMVAFGAVCSLVPIAGSFAQQNDTSSPHKTSENSTASSGSPGNAENGKRLFLSDGCYECHGILGQGATTGPRLAPNPIPAEGIMAYIRKPSGRMPPFSAKLVPDQDVMDIYAYLKSVPAPADVKNVPSFTK
jgi:mono/diheme cytochrome c family protein